MKKRKNFFVYAFLFFYLCVVLFPIFWAISTSLKTAQEVHIYPPHLIPHNPTLFNFVDLFKYSHFPFFLINSIVIALSVVGLSLLLGVPAGYSFSRIKFRYRNFLLGGIVGVRLIPPISLVIPFYLLMQRVGLYDTKFALILVHTLLNLPFVVWVMSNYFNSIPRELEDAAKIDGCSITGAFLRISLPLSLPGVIASMILCFVWSWNEFAVAQVLTMTEISKTLPVGVVDFLSADTVSWELLAAAGTIAVVPAIFFLMFAQRYVISGLTRGALKG